MSYLSVMVIAIKREEVTGAMGRVPPFKMFAANLLVLLTTQTFKHGTRLRRLPLAPDCEPCFGA